MSDDIKANLKKQVPLRVCEIGQLNITRLRLGDYEQDPETMKQFGVCIGSTDGDDSVWVNNEDLHTLGMTLVNEAKRLKESGSGFYNTCKEAFADRK